MKIDYTLARKDYIHKLLFSELISRKITFQSHTKIFFRQFISRKLHITYSFVAQSITWKNCLGIIFLENLISVTWNNLFRVNFAIISGWSVKLPEERGKNRLKLALKISPARWGKITLKGWNGLVAIWISDSESMFRNSAWRLFDSLQESRTDPWPRYFWKVSRYTSHFYRDTFAKVCPPLGRK